MGELATLARAGRTTPAPAPAPDTLRPDRSLVFLATDGVAYLVHWVVILVLLGQALVVLLGQEPAATTGGAATSLVCLVWGTFCLGMGLLRGRYGSGVDVAPPGWLAVIATAGCLVSLETVRQVGSPMAPWSAQLLVAALLVAAITVWAGALAGGGAGLLLTGLVLSGGVGGQVAQPDPRAAALHGAVLLAASFGGALALVGLRRTATDLQRSLDLRDAALVREQTVRAAADLAAEVERSLHDTALNTLETVAAHGAHVDPAAIAARCRSDHDQLRAWRSQSSLVDLSQVLPRLEAHATHVGIALDARVLLPDGSLPARTVPAPVLQAISGAATEALTNVAKHAGAPQASVLLIARTGAVQLLVADRGIGPGPAATLGADPVRGGDEAGAGFGLARSVRARMHDVGGTAVVTPGPDGVGTVVVLAWAPDAPDGDGLGADLLTRSAAIVVALGALLSAVAAALVLLGWTLHQRPWAAIAAAVLPAAVAAALLVRGRHPGGVGGRQVALACLAYAAASGLEAVATGLVCSASRGQGLLLATRSPLLVVALLLAPRARVLAALLATVLATHLCLGLAWLAGWTGCGPEATSAGVYAVAVLVALWLFVRRIQRVTSQYASARAEASAAQVRIGARLAIRAEEEQWVADTLDSAQSLLRDLGDGSASPGDPQTRARCAAEAGFLRGMLAVGHAPAPLRRPARIWLRLLHASGCRLQVRGSFQGCTPPTATVWEVGGTLDALCALAPAAAVTLSAWSGPQGGSLAVSACGPAVQWAREPLAGRICSVAPHAWLDQDEDTTSVEWSWPREGAEQMAGGVLG